MGTTLRQLRDAIELVEGWGMKLDDEIVLVTDPDGQHMEPGTYGIGIVHPGESDIVAGLVGGLGKPGEI